MNWKILLFENNRKEKPVEKFIKSLSPQTIAKIVHTINLLEKFGSLLNMPHSKKIADNLFELRIRGKEEIRFYYTFRNKEIYLLHAYKKKSQKMPKKELKVALERVKLLT